MALQLSSSSTSLHTLYSTELPSNLERETEHNTPPTEEFANDLGKCAFSTHASSSLVHHDLRPRPSSSDTDLPANTVIGEIQAILARRKRLLTELFFLSKYVEVPQDHGEGEGAARAIVDSEDLSAFLSENDLESGKVLKEETLPDKIPDAVDASTQLELSKLRTPDDHQKVQQARKSIVTTGASGSGVLLAPVNNAAHTSDALEPGQPTKMSIDGVTTSEVPIVEPDSNNHSHPLRHALVTPLTKPRVTDFEATSWLYRAKENPLLDVVQVARKSMSTADWSAAHLESQWMKSLDRVEALKTANLWSLRQLTKQKSAPRRKAHWDYLLDEMQWLRTDFREERKWKMVLARKLALAVREWHVAKDRSSLVINPLPIRYLGASQDVPMKDLTTDNGPPTPPSGSDEIFSELHTASPQHRDERKLAPTSFDGTNMIHSPPLSAIDDPVNVFDVANQDVYAYLSDTGRDSPSLVPDMPIYGPSLPLEAQYEDPLDSMPLINTSCFAQCESRVRIPKKRPLVDEETSDNAKVEFERAIPSFHARRKSSQSPMTMRPPFLPPNLDRRQSDRKDHQVVWTSEADDMLLHLLNEYQYNWEFVAQAMTPSNMICAVADRKSPWDCFERWVQIDPRSNDVVFTGAHARVVQSKVDDMIRSPRTPGAPKRSSSYAHKSQQPEPKRQRQLSMFDVMRKVQRKRENQPKAAPPKKPVTESTKTPPTVPNPQELSRMKFERDQQIARAFHESKNQQLQALQQQRLMQQQQQQQQQQHQQQHHQQQQQQQPQMQKPSPQPTPAQIAQLQAARQTQHRAQLAQQAVANGNGLVVNGTSPNVQMNRGPMTGSRPSLVGQMPARPLPVTTPTSNMHKPVQMPNNQLPNSAQLRIPPGGRLNQEQMNQLIVQARLQRGLSATPSPSLQPNGSHLNGHSQQPNGRPQTGPHGHGVSIAGSPSPLSVVPTSNTPQQQQTQSQLVGTPKTPITPKTPLNQTPVLQKEPQSEAAR